MVLRTWMASWGMSAAPLPLANIMHRPSGKRSSFPSCKVSVCKLYSVASAERFAKPFADCHATKLQVPIINTRRQCPSPAHGIHGLSKGCYVTCHAASGMSCSHWMFDAWAQLLQLHLPPAKCFTIAQNAALTTGAGAHLTKSSTAWMSTVAAHLMRMVNERSNGLSSPGMLTCVIAPPFRPLGCAVITHKSRLSLFILFQHLSQFKFYELIFCFILPQLL